MMSTQSHCFFAGLCSSSWHKRLFLALLVQLPIVLLFLSASLMSGTPSAHAKGERKGQLTISTTGLRELSKGRTAQIVVTGPKVGKQARVFRRVLSTGGGRGKQALLKLSNLPLGRYKLAPQPIQWRIQEELVRGFEPISRTRLVSLTKRRPRAQVDLPYQGFRKTAPAPLDFDLENAVALVQTETNGQQTRSVAGVPSTRTASAESNLLALLPGGSVRDAIESGTLRDDGNRPVRVQHTLIAPDGDVILLFTGAPLINETTRCLLVRVDPETSAGSCVDRELSAVVALRRFGRLGWVGKLPSLLSSGTLAATNDPVDDATSIFSTFRTREKLMFGFDASGAFYYFGATSSGKRILRKSLPDGTVIDLLSVPNDTVIVDFLVTRGGSVIADLETTNILNRDVSYRRQIMSDTGDWGEPTSFDPSSYESIEQFSDGRIYKAAVNGLQVFDETRETFDPRYWLSAPGLPFRGEDFLGRDPYIDATQMCLDRGSKASDEFDELCGLRGDGFGLHLSLDGDRDLFLRRDDQERVDEKVLLQVLPSLQVIETGFRKITSLDSTTDSLLLAGADRTTGSFVLALIDPETGIRRTIPIDQDVRLTNIRYVPALDKAIVRGFTISTRSFFNGEVDLASETLSINDSFSMPYIDVVSLRD